VGSQRVVTDAIAVLTERLATNPRVAQQIEQIARALRAQTGEIRLRVQTMLSRRQLPVRQQTSRPASGPSSRTALAFGVYCELELRAPLIKWKGKADLLTFTAEVCELTDFKTGERSEEHRFQVVAYALLWSRDSELNPSKRLADRLVLAYSDGDIVTVAPSASELDAFERELIQRSSAVRLSLTQVPPEARPSPGTCRYCVVRHLCDAYWRSPELVALSPEKAFGDLEATVVKRHGPTSWDIVVESSRDRPAGLLRTAVGIEFRIGERLRIVDGAIRVLEPASTDPVVVTVGSATELFAVSTS
jgi:CRISPR/Cas system-associated exonuclease Cas4 (RecB family)